MSKQQQKQRQTSEPSGDDEAENRKRPFRAPAMLSTIRDYVDRFDGARKELNHKEGKKFNIDTFQRQEADYRELHRFYQVKPVGQTYDGLDRGSSTAVSQTGVSIAQVLSPANYFFFVNPESPFDGGFSVHSLAAQQVAIKRGFREVNFSHLSAIEQIPHRAKKLPPSKQLIYPHQVLCACRKAPYQTCSGTARSLMLSRSFEHLKTNSLTPRRRFPTLHAGFGHQRRGRQQGTRALVALEPYTLGAMVTMPCVPLKQM